MDASPTSSSRLKIFFDGGCRICDWEVQKYLELDSHSRLEPVDILSPEFAAGEYGLDPARVRKFFHVQTADGRTIAGVDAFIEIWKTLDRPLGRVASRLAKFAPVHFLLGLGYRGFVEVRPFLPRKPGAPSCDSVSCQR